MSMNLAGTLRRLEQKAGIHGPCPRCRDLGWGVSVTVSSPEEIPNLEGKGCPLCGKISSIKRIVLLDADITPEEWRRLCGVNQR